MKNIDEFLRNFTYLGHTVSTLILTPMFKVDAQQGHQQNYFFMIIQG